MEVQSTRITRRLRYHAARGVSQNPVDHGVLDRRQRKPNRQHAQTAVIAQALR